MHVCQFPFLKLLILWFYKLSWLPKTQIHIQPLIMVFQFDGQLTIGPLCRFVQATKFSITILSCHLLLSLKETKQCQFCCDFERLVSNLVELQEELFLSRKMQLVIIKNSLKIYTAELLFKSFHLYISTLEAFYTMWNENPNITIYLSTC